jgi:hypothetical protein
MGGELNVGNLDKEIRFSIADSLGSLLKRRLQQIVTLLLCIGLSFNFSKLVGLWLFREISLSRFRLHLWVFFGPSPSFLLLHLRRSSLSGRRG